LANNEQEEETEDEIDEIFAEYKKSMKGENDLPDVDRSTDNITTLINLINNKYLFFSI